MPIIQNETYIQEEKFKVQFSIKYKEMIDEAKIKQETYTHTSIK